MKISDFSSAELESALIKNELLIGTPPFVVRIQSDVTTLSRDIAHVYADFDICPPGSFADFHIQIMREPGLRRWFKPLARFFFDGQPSFVPLPSYQALAMLEWGFNWCVAAHSHQFLIIHAAVVEKDGKAAVLPAPPGSGKSTLCAALVLRGWRLLSDELALYDMTAGMVWGMARPLNLKNRSIDVIQTFEPSAVFSIRVPNTTKGTVALLRPPHESVRRAREPARPAFVVVPRYEAGAAALLSSRSKASTLMLMAEQSFNYDIHGENGFRGMERLVDAVDCYDLTYSKLDDGIRIFQDLFVEAE